MSSNYRIGYGRPPREHCFKPGKSGNPGGLRRGTPRISAALDKFLAYSPDKPMVAESNADAIAITTIEQAIGGSPWAVQFIVERREGKAPANPEVLMTAEDEMDIEREAIEAGLQSWVDNMPGSTREDAIRFLREINPRTGESWMPDIDRILGIESSDMTIALVT